MLGEENPAEYDGIITAVGPRSVLSLKDNFTVNHCPIILFENDITLVDTLRKLTGNKRIYFGIPDVITSNTAPKQLPIITIGSCILSVLIIETVSAVTQSSVHSFGDWVEPYPGKSGHKTENLEGTKEEIGSKVLWSDPQPCKAKWVNGSFPIFGIVYFFCIY